MAETARALDRNGNRGYFEGNDCIKEAEETIRQLEMRTHYKYSIVKSDNFKLLDGPFAHYKIFWEENSCDASPIIFDGVPFVIVGKQRRECFHGPDRNLSKKIKRRNRKKADHPYGEKGRKLVQPTHKRNCPAFIMLRYIIKFPEYRIHSNSSYQRKRQGQQLKTDLQNSASVEHQHRVYFSLPEDSEHKNHVKGEFGSVFQPVDKAIIAKIKSLVIEGVRSVSEMKRHLKTFTKENFPGVPELSNRFYPSNKDIRNHMTTALKLEQYSDEDQENLRILLNQWRIEENPKDSFCYIPSAHAESDDDIQDFIFVHQNSDQKRLMARYGNEICLLDSTHNTTKYDLPLFFVCVSTNIGYMVVGSFIVPTESAYNIVRGLQVLKEWNPTWMPKYFMTDYHRGEMNAIEKTFPGCFTYLCDFHREQAWQRWVGPSHGVKEPDELLKLMRSIANAESEEEFKAAVDSLKVSDHWKLNCMFRKWFQTHWLSVSERWVQYHRQTLLNVRVNTTNGLETQHKEFKQNYLSSYTEGSLSSMVTTLIKKFLPERYKRYVQYNVKSVYKKYASEVPRFLHCKPKLLVDHCLDRLPTSDHPAVSSAEEVGQKRFKVTSYDSGRVYEVDLSQALPRCSCKDWFNTHWPCKHMLHVMMNIPGHDWHTLSNEFVNAPHMCCDIDIFENNEVADHVSVLDDTPVNASSKKKGGPDRHLNSKRPVAVATRCKTLASSIGNMLFLLRDPADYEDVYVDLLSIHKKLVSRIPSQSGLLLRPIRRGRKPSVLQHRPLKLRKKRKGTRKPVSKMTVKPKDHVFVSCGARIIPQDSLLTENVSLNKKENLYKKQLVDNSVSKIDTGPRLHSKSGTASNDNTSSDEVQLIWNLPQDFDVPVAKVYGRIVTDTDIRSLKSPEWLTDNVMDTYLNMLCVELTEQNLGRMIHIDSTTMSSIINRTYSSRNLPNLRDCLFVVGAYCRGGHWVLVILDVVQKKVYFYNPILHNEAVESRSIKEAMCRYISSCLAEPEEVTHKEWRLSSFRHTSQTDSYNCGIFCLIFAEKHLTGGEHSLTCITQSDLDHMRWNVAKKIMDLKCSLLVAAQSVGCLLTTVKIRPEKIYSSHNIIDGMVSGEQGIG
ncbi:uncharacterized protein LOC123553026 [Mercenaria mercenaria]|uniref:uncharacterized protein LOC123553026 n=1 Tax=Mercenaria mercenaria TaxID=6596 RepID=UPI00234F9DF5|nr:uncharacterized protein LOC123553026 [Mercenaria mercenaria]